MANGGLQQMMKENFPKQKLNPNPMQMSLKIRRILDLQKKLWESDNIRIRIRTLSHPYSQAMLTVTEQQHRRPSEAAVDHPPSWLASSC